MRERLKDWIRQLLQVPPKPEVPLGGPGSLRVFRAAPGFLRYRLLGWGLSMGGTIVGIIFGVVAVRQFAPAISEMFFILEALAIAFLAIQLPVSFLMIVLDYEYRWYMVTDRSLRIREGVVKVQEKTMTFSNVQNVSIRQGPIQRLFGISDVEVRTAGGGESSSGGGDHQGLGDNLHLGYFRGVGNAAEIRDAILDHLKRLRSGGLGDPDEPPAPASEPGSVAASTSVDTEDLLDAGRQVLAEAKALRQAVSSSAGLILRPSPRRYP